MSLPAFLAVESEPFSVEDDLDVAGLPVTDAAIAWCITSTGEAEWAAAKWAEADAAVSAAVAQADEWHERVGEWLDAVAASDVGRAAFFESALTDYARARRDQDPRAKTLTLPSATVKSRSVAARVVVADSDAALDWLRQNAPEAVKVVESVSMSELRRLAKVHEDRAVLPDGQVVPGVEVEPEHVSYSVTVAR
jgi:hypothetical protein